MWEATLNAALELSAVTGSKQLGNDASTCCLEAQRVAAFGPTVTRRYRDRHMACGA